MLKDEDQWLSLIDSFGAAALDADSWQEALARLAAATGSRAGQLVGFGAAAPASFNWIADPEPGWVEELIASGGNDARVNPRMRMGLQVPCLKVITDADVVSKEARRRSSFYAKLLPRLGIPFIGATTLVREREMVVGLAVLRTHRQGELDRGQRAVLESVAPHVRTAVRTQMALEHQGAALLAGAMHALSLSVFVCDRSGAVRSMTAAAEALLDEGPLGLRQGQLQAGHPVQTRALTEAIDSAAASLQKPGAPLASTVLVGNRAARLLALDVVPLPRRAYNFGFEPRVMVVARTTQENPSRSRQLLQAAYRLTGAESEIALSLATGQSPEAIAAARGASLATVRVQMRAIYSKLSVRRQGELVALINQLG
jgi:DNA-binding CsgD family transcriptional regulator/GAF domain-containing protein